MIFHIKMKIFIFKEPFEYIASLRLEITRFSILAAATK